MNINLLSFIQSKTPYFQSSNVKNRNNSITFCASETQQNDLDKLYSIMSKQQLDKEFKNIAKNLKLDYVPNFEIVESYKDGRGGGYNFYRNEVSLCASDMVCSDYKIVGTKAGKSTVLIDSKTQCPLFSTKDMAEEFIKNAQMHKNYNYDSLKIVPTTLNDKKRLIIQKLSHELIHAQQHMLMRQTDGIDEKMIIKAWTHAKPATIEQQKQLDEFVEKSFNNSFWGNKPKTTNKIFKNSPAYYITTMWLNSVQNYPPVDSLEYLRTPIETDAYRRSADYVMNIFGQLSP